MGDDTGLDIVAVGAHPDDIEFGAGGVLTLLARRDHRLHFVTMTAGDLGSPNMMDDDIAATRFEEARTSAEQFGATYDCIGTGDLRIGTSGEAVKELVRVFRKYEVDVVLTHPRRDYMEDHEQTHRAVRDAANRLPILRYRRMQVRSGNYPEALESTPRMYYWAPHGGLDWEGSPFSAHFLIALDEGVLDAKRDALACHASQREWLRRHYGTDEYIESMEELSRQWIPHFGIENEVDTPYAEPFVQDLGAAYSRGDVLAEQLQEHHLPTRHYKRGEDGEAQRFMSS